MAACDNVLYHASVSSGLAADTVIPLALQYGIENVRQGYGTPRLKSVKAFFDGVYSSNTENYAIEVDIKNSSWVDPAGLMAVFWDAHTALIKQSLGFMDGYDKELAPNTSWTINAVLSGGASTAVGDIWVLLEIEYSDVPGLDPEKIITASPVMKRCYNASVTGSANTIISIGTFDNLHTDVKYVLSEVSIEVANAHAAAHFVVLEGFSNQRGLTRIIPCKNNGVADQIKGSVYLTKQTYNLAMIRGASISASPVKINLELLASKN